MVLSRLQFYTTHTHIHTHLFRVYFKILLVVFKGLNGPVLFFILQSPTQVYGPSQTLKSSTAALLTAPKAATKTYGDAAFQPLWPKVMAKISGFC